MGGALGVLGSAIALIAGLVAVLIVLGIAMVVLGANEDNTIVGAILDVADFLVGPFDDLFELDDEKKRVAVNYGIAAAIYGLGGTALGRAIQGIGRGPTGAPR